MHGVNLAPKQPQIYLHHKWLPAPRYQWIYSKKAVRSEPSIKPSTRLFCLLFQLLLPFHWGTAVSILEFSEEMWDKYTAYSSSLTIHLGQMKASNQLEGVCYNPLSTLSLFLPFRSCQHRRGGDERVFARHLAQSLCDRLHHRKTCTLDGSGNKSSCGSICT